MAALYWGIIAGTDALVYWQFAGEHINGYYILSTPARLLAYFWEFLVSGCLYYLALLRGCGCHGAAVTWDPANVLAGSGEDPTVGAANLGAYIEHVHFKDEKLLGDGKRDITLLGLGGALGAAVGFTAFSHFKPTFHHPGITFDPSPRAATLHMVVAKEGRTTGTTKGMVIGLNAQVGPVGYGQGPDGMPRFGGFSGQILVEGLNGLDFSQAGDSGSLIVGLVDGAFHPVALLVGGNVPTDAGANGTFGCPIDEVMTALNIVEILDHEVE